MLSSDANRHSLAFIVTSTVEAAPNCAQQSTYFIDFRHQAASLVTCRHVACLVCLLHLFKFCSTNVESSVSRFISLREAVPAAFLAVGVVTVVVVVESYG